MSIHPYTVAALQRGAWHFLSGKAVSGMLTLAILLWLVRLLPVEEYGAYVSLIATTELAFALGGLGLPWAAARFLPEARLNASHGVTRTLVWRLAWWQAGVLGLIAVMVGLTYRTLLPSLDMAVSVGIGIATAGLIFAEGTGRFLRDGLLSPLMCQNTVRNSLIFRQVLFILSIAGLDFTQQTSLGAVLAAELAASAIAAVVAIVGLARHLRELPALANHTGWVPPTARDLWLVALPMYGGHLLALAYGPQVFLLLLQRFAGAEAAAVFGFLRTIYEQAARYLPATLLFSLVRPKLVASYVGGGGMAELSRNTNLAGKLSLFVLMPVLAFSFKGGEPLVALLSGNKFPDTRLLFFGFMLALVPYSQRQLLETVAVTAGRAGLCTLGAGMGLLALPLMFWQLSVDAGPWAGVATLGIGHLLFVLSVMAGLKATGYGADMASLTKLALAAVTSGGATMLVPHQTTPMIELTALALTAGTVFLGMAWLLSPFPAAERLRMNQLLGKNVFRA